MLKFIEAQNISNYIMKKSFLLLSLGLLSFTSAISQNNETPVEANTEAGQTASFNRWTVELSAGQSKGLNPYSEGYYSSNPERYLGTFSFNNWNAAVRYMFSPKFGVKLDFGSDLLRNAKGSGSLDFKTQQYRIAVQGVVNAARLFDIQRELGRFNFLVHAGLQVSQLTPKSETRFDLVTKTTVVNDTYNDTEDNGGLIFGISPEVRIFKKFSIIADYSMLLNFRQHYTFNGQQPTDKSVSNLTGQMTNLSIGLTYSFGAEKIHGDYSVIYSDEMLALNALDKKVGEMEAMMNDIDKDGVPDYLDVENNSLAGVAVDTKGRMIDMNKNGVPDELEVYLADTYIDKSEVTNNNLIEGANSELIKKMINQGYVAAYFEFDVPQPTDTSSDGIGIILNYLRTNPTSTVDIIGHADELGNTKYNVKLATTRAINVKSVLVKSGINAYRINVVPGGIDKSVDPKSVEARRLVRKVTFKVKE